MSIRSLLPSLLVGTALVFAVSGRAAADDLPGANSSAPTFGSRTDKPDGSSSMTFGRRLPTVWDSKVGTDVSLAPADDGVPDVLPRSPMQDRSTGAVWGNLTMPGFQPLGFDKTSVDARVDSGNDQGKLGATLSRSIPLGREFSVTVEHSNAVTQSFAQPATSLAAPASTPSAPTPAQAWRTDETVRFNFNEFGTAFSAGAGSSTADTRWHNKLSVEQPLFGPLKVVTSVEDAGSSTMARSITAAFKKSW